MILRPLSLFSTVVCEMTKLLLAVDKFTQLAQESFIMRTKLYENKKLQAFLRFALDKICQGYLVAYQNFEYAVGHWLQKTAEHVLGCVLCSPGCFSLMRVSYLNADNVMAMYKSLARTPMQKLQYDQGEDRWLCTLMLMSGKDSRLSIKEVSVDSV